MTYSCTDLADDVLEALKIVEQVDDSDNPSAQADLCLAEIGRLQEIELIATDPKSIKTNYLIIETAMTAYNALEDSRLITGTTLPDDHPFKAAEQMMTTWSENSGAAAMRSAAWELSPIIEKVWSGMSEAERDGLICWDFEFVPEFLLFLVDWDTGPDDITPISDDVEDLRKQYREAREKSKAFVGGTASSRDRDTFIKECREEADKQWGYADLVSDHIEKVQSAFEAKEKPGEFIKTLGEDYDLSPVDPWRF